MKYERLTESNVPCSVASRKFGGKHEQYYYRLAELEDDLESGKMIRLPCKVGDTVYHICYPHIFEDIVDEIWINDYNEVCYNFRNGCCYLLSEFGVKWFTTKAEAEKKLKELKGEV